VSGDSSVRPPGRRFPPGPSLASLAVLLFAAQLAAPARGALFDDDEARRRIEDLKNRVDLVERSLAQRLDALEAKGAGLADLFRDVEQIKSDIAKLRGQYEVLTYELEQAQKRQRDLYLDLDGRVRKLEGGPGAPGAPPGPGAPPASGDAGAPAAAAAAPAAVADPASEQKSYDAALEAFKSGNFGAAVGSFQAFTRTYPKSVTRVDDEPYLGTKAQSIAENGVFTRLHTTLVRRMTWQSKTRTSIGNCSNRSLLGWMRLPCKSRRQKSRRLPVGTKMTVRTTIRAIGDNLVAIVGRGELSLARKNLHRLGDLTFKIG